MLTRRQFLKSSPLVALSPSLPAFLARSAHAMQLDRHERILVVVQLDGGNDALNTVVPHTDPVYARLRPRLKIAAKDLLKLDDGVGLHPSLRPLGGLLEKGQLAVIPGVSYPNPSRSHFRGMAIWHSAKLESEHTGYGWLGRGLDVGGGSSTHIGPGAVPLALWSRRSLAISFDRPDDLLLRNAAASKESLGEETQDDLISFIRRQSADGCTAAQKMATLSKGGDARYPASGLAERLRLAAQLLKSDLGARVFYTLQSGYDTHASQSFTHANLLSEFAEAVKAFFADLHDSNLSERVILMAFSEFGRTIKENGSGGTDHGTTGCVFLAGPGLKRHALMGVMPNLTDLEKGEPKMTVDFRSIYANILDGWLSCPSEKVLDARYEKLGFL
jgi:uncharacterized protein (DUF1501 family)